jgi:hypothetical protein
MPVFLRMTYADKDRADEVLEVDGPVRLEAGTTRGLISTKFDLASLTSVEILAEDPAAKKSARAKREPATKPKAVSSSVSSSEDRAASSTSSGTRVSSSSRSSVAKS